MTDEYSVQARVRGELEPVWMTLVLRKTCLNESNSMDSPSWASLLIELESKYVIGASGPSIDFSSPKHYLKSGFSDPSAASAMKLTAFADFCRDSASSTDMPGSLAEKCAKAETILEELRALFSQSWQRGKKKIIYDLERDDCYGN